MSNRNRIVKVLAPAAGKGPELEMAAALRVLDSSPSFVTLHKLLSYHNRSIALLVARCLLLSGNTQHAEEHHPIVRHAQGYPIFEASEVGWYSSPILWGGLATALFGFFFLLDLSSRGAQIPILSMLYIPVIAGIWWLAGRFGRSVITRQMTGYVRGGIVKPSVAWSLAAINTLLPMARDEDSEIQRDVIAALDPVIPLLRCEDREMLTDSTIHCMVALAEADDDPDVSRAFRLKLIQALGALGAIDTIPSLQTIESTGTESDELRLAARESIESIRDRYRHQHESEELLRPATVVQTDSLLRPAEDAPSDVQTLLHIPDQ